MNPTSMKREKGKVMVEVVDHRDASSNKPVMGIAGSNENGYGISLVNL